VSIIVASWSGSAGYQVPAIAEGRIRPGGTIGAEKAVGDGVEASAGEIRVVAVVSVLSSPAEGAGEAGENGVEASTGGSAVTAVSSAGVAVDAAQAERRTTKVVTTSQKDR
jgi:hypothetical protein